MDRSTDSRRARNSDSVMIGGRRRPVSRPSRRRCFLASSRVEPLTERTSLLAEPAGPALLAEPAASAGLAVGSPPCPPVSGRPAAGLGRGVLVAVPAAAAAGAPPAAPSRAGSVVIVAGTLAVAGRARGSALARGFRTGRRGLGPRSRLRPRRGRLEHHLRRLE